MTTPKIYPWGDQRRYNSYSRHFRTLFGGRVQKVTVNAGFTCPNRDGSKGRGGCTFCNNEAFTPSYCMRGYDVRRQIEEGIAFHRKRYRTAENYLAYYQSFSNTYAPLERLKEIYSQALKIPEIKGLVIGTRPDCVDEAKLDYFASLAEKLHVAIEYGVESCYDHTLQRVNRGHTFADAADAIGKTRQRGIHVGAHFIVGLPGETDAMALDAVPLINSLGLDSVKFHQLQLFRGTQMELEYLENPDAFRFHTLDEYLDLFCDILARLAPSIVVERFAGEAPPRYHAAGGWGMVRNETLLQMLENRLEERGVHQGMLY